MPLQSDALAQSTLTANLSSNALTSALTSQSSMSAILSRKDLTISIVTQSSTSTTISRKDLAINLIAQPQSSFGLKLPQLTTDFKASIRVLGALSTSSPSLTVSFASTSSFGGILQLPFKFNNPTLVTGPKLGIGPSGKNYLFDTQTAGLRMNERSLLMRVNREVISKQGVDVYLLPQQYTNVDGLFGEDRTPLLNVAKKIVMYIKDAYNGLAGGAIYSKFGFSNQQTMDFIVSAAEWENIFPPSVVGNPIRPMEGDIIYIPRWSKWGPTDFLKITFVDKYDANGYFPLGEHYAFVLSTEKWSYSSEHLNTGIPDIDSQEISFTNDISINDNFQASPEAQNNIIQTLANRVIDFSADNPFGNV